MKKTLIALLTMIAFSVNAQTDDQQRLTELKNNFTFLKDEKSQINYYEPLVEKKFLPKQTRLKTSVSPDGTINLSSIYYGKGWIKHSSVMVKIGDNIYSTEVNENAKKETIGAGTVFECVSYSGSNNYLFKMITSNKGKVIKVIFVGKDDYDYTLSDNEMRAISDSYELAQLLKKYPQ